jgi:hypothetical protein
VTVPESLPLSLHPVDAIWVNQRAKELSDARGLKRPDVKGALTEVVDRFVDQAGDNLDESRNLVLYQPSSETDPYIVAVPVKEAVTVGEASPAPAETQKPASFHENPNTIQEEFENMLFETEVGATPSELEKDANGRYINSRIRLLWFGFNMYHQKMTMARRADFREDYHKPLGSYVVCKVTETGATIFTKVPTRFKTKAQGYEEARRLQAEQGEAWGIWRCMDIIGFQDLKDSDEE